MPKNLSVSEIKAVAETAITAQHTADAAKKAHEANPSDTSLKSAHETAQAAAADAKAKADALSQQTLKTPEQIAKIKRKRAILTQELRDAGELDAEDTDDDMDDDAIDPNKPVTFGDLERMQAREAAKTAVQMAEAIPDAAAKAAVKEALLRVVPSGDAQKDFTDAVAIANRERNNKILEEISRKPPQIAHRSGSGAPPRPADAIFEATAEEARYMRPPFNLSKDQIIAARPKT